MGLYNFLGFIMLVVALFASLLGQDNVEKDVAVCFSLVLAYISFATQAVLTRIDGKE